MRPVYCALLVGLLAFSGTVGLIGVGGCDNSSSTYDPQVHDPALRPQIVNVAGPAGGGVRCRPEDTGGNCPLPIRVTFTLAASQIVTKAIVTFQGEGSDRGVDRYYAIPQTAGQDGNPVTLDIAADIPTTILRQNALFTYTVRIVTANGAESEETTLTVSVT